MLGLSHVKANEEFENLLENPYRVFKIPPWSSTEAIRKRYNELARKYHPDKKSGSNQKFMTIQRAYEQLKNERKILDEDEVSDHLANIVLEFVQYATATFLVLGGLYYFFWTCFKVFEFIWKFLTVMVISGVFCQKFLPHLFSSGSSQTLCSICLGLGLYYSGNILNIFGSLCSRDKAKDKKN